MEKKQTAVQWLIENAKGFHNAESSKAMQEQALQMEREQMIDLVESLKDYTHESHVILGLDERESSEFVDIYYTKTFKP